MLCAKCHEREATVHFTKIEGDKVTKVDLCIDCAQPEMSKQKGIELGDLMEILHSGKSPAAMRAELMKSALGETAHYPIVAYEFVSDALETCHKGAHVSSHVLLQALRELALKKFSKRAKVALAEWKIFRTEDFGEIVFEMIDAGLLAKQLGDSKQGFQNGFNFDEAFPEV